MSNFCTYNTRCLHSGTSLGCVATEVLRRARVVCFSTMLAPSLSDPSLSSSSRSLATSSCTCRPSTFPSTLLFQTDWSFHGEFYGGFGFRLEQYKASEWAKACNKCCICCLKCLEKFLKYISQNAYTVIGTTLTFCSIVFFHASQ